MKHVAGENDVSFLVMGCKNTYQPTEYSLIMEQMP